MTTNSQQYTNNLPDYETVLTELKIELAYFFEEKHPTVDVQQINGRVKTLKSIEKKILDKSLKDITELDDIVGTSVICYTRPDAERAVVVLKEYLPQKYKVIKSEAKKTNDGYTGYHFNFIVGKNGKNIQAEIQVKSVLQYAWSVQSRKYLYKTVKEGDANILAKTVAGIFENCENLWELVKKSSISNNVPSAELDQIEQDINNRIVQKETPSKKLVTQGQFVDTLVVLLKNYDDSAKVDLQDLIDSELDNIKKVWKEQYQNPSTIDYAKGALDVMEKTIKNITLIGLYAIKFNKIDLLKKILKSFNTIHNLSGNQDGLIVLLSVPAAILHNIYYELGAYAVKRDSAEALKALIDCKIEINHHGNTSYQYIWSVGSIIAPEILPGANIMFDRLRNGFINEDQRIQGILGVEPDKFLELICQFNMLFCIRKKQLEEIEPEKDTFRLLWAYLNFGRFYAERVTTLVRRIIYDADYAKYVEVIFEEPVKDFNKKTDNRIAQIAKKGLDSGGFFWESITHWII
jgi:ppGpp synthetase/RelA/SpoT-type nucleotidyltranferase